MTAVLHGDCLAILPMLPPDSFDSCVTDPPYHLLSIVKRFGKSGAYGGGFKEENGGTGAAFARMSRGFMGKQWDGGDVAARPETWAAVYRVLKPGSHLVAFGGTRTYHRMTCAIEDAGFEIRDCIQWIYGSGFPKSHDVSKGIDRAAGVDRDEIGIARGGVRPGGRYGADGQPGLSEADKWRPVTAPATDDARQWQGWGTALKPACEPIVLARKPLSEATVAANVLKWGTGAINIDGCRVETGDKLGGGDEKAETCAQFDNEGWQRPWMSDPEKREMHAAKVREKVVRAEALGRWPANVVHDGSDEVVQGFPDVGKSPPVGAMGDGSNSHSIFGDFAGEPHENGYGDSGSAARFFYTAKADGDERIGSKHPTVKPVDLMQWLVRLVTPKGGCVLDPFAGTGTTGEAAWREGCRATLIEREAEYLADIARRLELMKAGPDERAREIVKASGKAQGHEDLPLWGGL